MLCIFSVTSRRIIYRQRTSLFTKDHQNPLFELLILQQDVKEINYICESFLFKKHKYQTSCTMYDDYLYQISSCLYISTQLFIILIENHFYHIFQNRANKIMTSCVLENSGQLQICQTTVIICEKIIQKSKLAKYQMIYRHDKSNNNYTYLVLYQHLYLIQLQSGNS